jgi:hypothetical protein
MPPRACNSGWAYIGVLLIDSQSINNDKNQLAKLDIAAIFAVYS